MLVSKNAIIFGETQLAISCINHLLDNAWEVKAVFTGDIVVTNWCKEQSIECLDIEQAAKFSVNSSNCYIFSIINPYILSVKLLKHLKSIKAINYHDSLLPKYAGVNSTTWAILNNEKSHGISWHEMVNRVDEGDIYYQTKVQIDKTDTAFSLNIKCTDAALGGFAQIIKNIESDKLVSIKQNVSKKTYFSRNNIPTNYAYLNPTDTMLYINRLLNSLNFGDGYTNPISTVKIKMDNASYILENSTVQEDMAVFDSSCYVLKNMYGNKIGSNFDITQIEPYVLTESEITSCKKLKQKEFTIHQNLFSLLNRLEAQSGLLSYAMVSNDREELKFDKGMSAETLSLFLSIILSRLNTNEIFIKIYHKNSNSYTDRIKNISENISMLAIKQADLDLHYNELSQQIANRVNNRIHVFKDFGYRHNLNLCSEFAITNNYSEQIDNHSVVFIVNHNKVSVKFYQKDADFIKMLIKTIGVLFDGHHDAQNANEQVKKLQLLSKEDYQTVIYDWNKTAKEYSDNKTIQQLFEEQVLKTPDNIAVIYEDIKLTYKSLNEQSNQLAHYLQKKYQIQSDDLIALCLNRNEYMLITILGVLKSGAAYVPIAPDFPTERIAYILKDTQAKVLITTSHCEDHSNEAPPSYSSLTYHSGGGKIPFQDILTIDDKKIVQVLRNYPMFNPKPNITSKNLAYVIYTSGTTGVPKGVMLQQQGVVNRIQWMNDKYPLVEHDRILQKTPYIFDVSVWELFWGIWYGATIVFAEPYGHKNPEYLVKLIRQEEITMVHFVPSMLRVFTKTLEVMLNGSIVSLNTLRHIFCSGEDLPLSYVKDIHRLLPFVKIHNLYGPTEATVDVLYYDFNVDGIGEIYIGRPISNITCYILDNNLNPLPIGGIGELLVGGVGLALGYLNLPDLTNACFIANPFQSVEEKINGKNSRLYKTGDLVRYLSDGTLEYIGRNDFQVKIHGYRIELGEIENVLLSYPKIEHCAVLNKKLSSTNGNQLSDNTYLVAYYVADKDLGETEILAYMSQKLPNYMLPNIFIRIEKLPLTVNGKLDKSTLPSPELTTKSEYVAPRNELEQKVCIIYAETLGLPTEVIGVTNDFFKLGGNSILAIKLTNKLSSQLNINLNMTALFKYKTISEMLAQVRHNNMRVVLIPKSTISSDSHYPLSFAQERLWFIDRYENGSNLYNIPLVFELGKNVNLTILKRAIGSVIERHEILHSLIITDDFGNSYQKICNLATEPQVFNEQIALDKVELNHLINQTINYIYKLNEEYPIKVSFFSKNTAKSKKNYLCIVVHHIAFDEWSIDIFLNELQNYYNYYYKLESGKNAALNLPELPIQYKDYAIWQKSYVNGNLLEEQLKYWLKKLDGYQTLNLPLDNYRSQDVNYIGNDIPFILDEVTSNKLRDLAKNLNVSLYSVLLSGYYILLSSYSNQDDIVIGIPVANRHYKQLESLIGFFVNSLALRSKISKDNLLIDYIKTVSAEIVEAQLYQDLPFEKLVTELNVLQDTTRHPIFQIMFTIQSFESTVAKYSKLFKLYQNYEYKIAKFDITTFIEDSQTALKGTFNYATSLFNQETILYMIKTFKHILGQIAELDVNSNTQIKGLSYLSKEEYQKVVYDWNKAEKECTYDETTIHQLFEEQVKKTPNNIAVVHEDVELTYKGLNERSNQLAHYLKSKYQIKEDALIALCLNRNEHVLIAIFGVLKSGAAYVPIDPDYPEERINYILEDTRAIVLITDSRCHIHTGGNPDTLIIDNQKFAQILKKYPTSDLKLNITNKNLAYVIYTSGTTGRPKGVMVEHEKVKLFSINNNYFSVNSGTIVLGYSNYAFDASIFDIFTTLLNGGKLIVTNKDLVLDIARFTHLIRQYKINTLFITTALFTHYIRLEKHNPLVNIKNILFGGEKISLKELGQFVCDNPELNLIHVYGPTENIVFSTFCKITPDNCQIAPIGKHLNDKKTYILDSNLTPLPIGAVGELYIAGSGVARGYLNLPKLTNERFLNNPFQTEDEKLLITNSKLYKTGDLVRMRSDGNIKYIGRNDSQVKIRGFRIELGEIEASLLNYDGITQVVAVAEELVDNKKGISINSHIVVYYVASAKLNEQEILRYLLTKLPNYMIPNSLIWLKEIPLTINGKLDRTALPKHQMILNNDYIAPHNIAEFKICSVYSEILNLPNDQVGIKHDFFKLGGNSILAIKLLYKLQQEFKINLNDIFKLRVPAKIAKLAPAASGSLYNKLKQMKLIYDMLSSYKISREMQKKKKVYLQSVKQINFVNQLKNISNVLLTGATGHLGCHMLYQLLHETEYNIYLPIRAKSNTDAYSRVNNKFKYYFDIGFDDFRHRIIAIAADIEKPDLNVSKKQYQSLINDIDSIIHSAALVKHYGDYTTFYQANVQTTINLLELAKQTRLKDFHYISTLSVLENSCIPNYHYYIFTEDDDFIGLKHNNNVYVQTKYEGELATIKYREFGVNSNIYRIGNLVMNSKNYRIQQNIEENAFFIRVKTILKMGMIPKEIAKVEVSPVDYTALAIIKLFNQTELGNKIYHIANPHICELTDLFAGYSDINVKTVILKEFINAMLVRLNNRIDHERIELFMLHQMWLEDINLEQLTKIIVFQNKTDIILSKLNFRWTSITSKMISDIITKSFLGDKKMKKKEPIFEYLESIAELIPAPFYWLDIDGRTIGVNALGMKVMGVSNKADIIGKTVYEIYKNKDIADRLQNDNNKILQTGESSQTEDMTVDVKTGKTKYFSATRGPLRNKKGEIVGIVGTSIEITAQKEKLIAEKEAARLTHANKKLEAQNRLHQITLEKEAAESERLRLENQVHKLENEKHKIATKEQEKFRKIVGQVVHDIQSPLAGLRGIVEDAAGSIPEAKRITLRQASMRISDIAQHMLNQYKNKPDSNERAEPMLVSTSLLDILSEKRFEYKDIIIDTEIRANAHFSFIQIEPSQFKRMISNVINNAVQALGGKSDGEVTVELSITPEWVFVFIEDNGCGMSQELIDKVESNNSVTQGKAEGSGLGLMQVRETLQRNYGALHIDSVEDNYTIVMLKFPKILPPFWIAEEVKIVKGDTIVVLDDDPSIHGAWDMKLRATLAKEPDLKVNHYTEGKDAINFINSLSASEKEQICLLADFELLEQGINGLEVIEQTKIKRATLVTSHYNNPEIRGSAANLRVKILPKSLAFAIPINLDKRIEPGSKKVDMVWVDDARWFIRDWKLRFANLNLVIDEYYDPDSFMEDVYQYPLDTKIVLDRNYYDGEGEGRKYLGDGLDVAKKLHKMGYTRLFMITGEEPEANIIPKYLKIILKEEDEKIKELAKL